MHAYETRKKRQMSQYCGLWVIVLLTHLFVLLD